MAPLVAGIVNGKVHFLSISGELKFDQSSTRYVTKLAEMSVRIRNWVPAALVYDQPEPVCQNRAACAECEYRERRSSGCTAPASL